MYPYFTRSCRVAISFENKQLFCSDVYISPQIRILLSKHFLVHWFNKRSTKKIRRTFQRHCNICNNITYSFLPAVMFFLTAENHVFDRNVKFFLQDFLVNLCKNEFVEINSVNVLHTYLLTYLLLECIYIFW